VSIVVVALLISMATLAYAAFSNTSSPSTTAFGGAPSPGINPSRSGAPSGNPSGSGSSSSGNGSGSAATGDWTQTAATIDVGVVDVESRLPHAIGAGTGMVLTADGEILTNNHVIDGASEIVVTVVTTGQQYQATVVGANATQDVAVLQLDGASGLQTIPLGDSSTVQVNDQVAAMGNAGGVGGTPSVAPGTVVALDQTITASDTDGSNAEQLDGLIEVNADVEPGDSGGPLASSDGKVIGMTTAASESGSSRRRATVHEGYAIPINQALTVAKQLESGQGNTAGSGSGSGTGTSSGSSSGNGSGSGSQSSHGYLGVEIAATAADGTNVAGAAVIAVVPASPAQVAGIGAGSVITSIDGKTISSPDDVSNALAPTKPGDKVSVGWSDDNGDHTATVTLGSN
jgi:S1-C subfamily serine protease